jgi:hypothetical protein
MTTDELREAATILQDVDWLTYFLDNNAKSKFLIFVEDEEGAERHAIKINMPDTVLVGIASGLRDKLIVQLAALGVI